MPKGAKFTDSVFYFVPEAVLDRVIAKHGGLT
jgi:hypothetical protein